MSWNVEKSGTIDEVLRALNEEIGRASEAYPHEADFMATQQRVLQVLSILHHPKQAAVLKFRGHIGADQGSAFVMEFNILPPGTTSAG